MDVGANPFTDVIMIKTYAEKEGNANTMQQRVNRAQAQVARLQNAYSALSASIASDEEAAAIAGTSNLGKGGAAMGLTFIAGFAVFYLIVRRIK